MIDARPLRTALLASKDSTSVGFGFITQLSVRDVPIKTALIVDKIMVDHAKSANKNST